MQLYELNPHIRYARIHTASFRLREEISICYDARLFFFEKAEGTLTLGDEKYNISNSLAVYLPPLQHYRFHVNFTKETRIIILDFDLISKYSHIKESIGTANPQNFDPSLAPAYDLPAELSSPIVKAIPEINTSLTQCASNYTSKVPFYRERSSAYLKLSLLEMVSQSKKYAHSDLCTQVLRYIHANYADTSLTNERIAEQFNYHSCHINRIMKNEAGRSLRSYIIYYRLEMAKNYLLTTQYSISEIAFLTGFCSAAHFIKVFREKIAMTPKDYRKNRLHTEI